MARSSRIKNFNFARRNNNFVNTALLICLIYCNACAFFNTPVQLVGYKKKKKKYIPNLLHHPTTRLVISQSSRRSYIRSAESAVWVTFDVAYTIFSAKPFNNFGILLFANTNIYNFLCAHLHNRVTRIFTIFYAFRFALFIRFSGVDNQIKFNLNKTQKI